MCRPEFTFTQDHTGSRKLEFVGWRQIVVQDKAGRVLTGGPGVGGIKVAAYMSHSMFPERTGEVVKHTYIDKEGKKSVIFVSDGSDGSTDFNDV